MFKKLLGSLCAVALLGAASPVLAAPAKGAKPPEVTKTTGVKAKGKVKVRKAKAKTEKTAKAKVAKPDAPKAKDAKIKSARKSPAPKK